MSSNKDLFKQAIAEAKSVREAAIANAKEALEETLTPHLKDMLAAKLQEMEDKSSDEEVVKEVEEDTMEEAQGNIDADDEKDHDQLEEGDGLEAVKEAEVEDEAEVDSEEAEDEAGEEEGEEEAHDEDLTDLSVEDFKDLIRDIISQEMGGGEEHTDMDAGDLEGSEELPAEAPEEEEINLEELLKELETETIEEEEEVTEDARNEMEAQSDTGEHNVNNIQSGTLKEETAELNEALTTIETLQKELNEVNILNAKLLYVNKIFKSNNLSESQKVNVIAAFDKAETVKEVKLVFETVADNFTNPQPAKRRAIKETKGMASKATGTTASKPEVISEVSDAVRRMQELAGII
jgi:hypothetical protein